MEFLGGSSIVFMLGMFLWGSRIVGWGSSIVGWEERDRFFVGNVFVGEPNRWEGSFWRETRSRFGDGETVSRIIPTLSAIAIIPRKNAILKIK
jgi:hypothetical protein